MAARWPKGTIAVATDAHWLSVVALTQSLYDGRHILIFSICGLSGAAPRGPRRVRVLPFLVVVGHVWSVAALVDVPDDAEDDAEVDAFADGLAVAAWAIAVPPPTRTPETANVIASFLSRCCIPITSFRSLESTSVKPDRLREG